MEFDLREPTNEQEGVFHHDVSVDIHHFGVQFQFLSLGFGVSSFRFDVQFQFLCLGFSISSFDFGVQFQFLCSGFGVSSFSFGIQFLFPDLHIDLIVFDSFYKQCFSEMICAPWQTVHDLA